MLLYATGSVLASNVVNISCRAHVYVSDKLKIASVSVFVLGVSGRVYMFLYVIVCNYITVCYWILARFQFGEHQL